MVALSDNTPMYDDPAYILSNHSKLWIAEPMFSTIAVLKEEWDNADWERFIRTLDFLYDDGFGSQHLFGIVWFKDGSWLERYEYDGAESWHYKRTPPVPDSLKGQLNGSTN